MEKLSPEQIALIKKPLPAEAISKHPTKTYLSSIKAIYVTERLNEVFGIGAWQVKVKKEVDLDAVKGMTIVHVTFEIPSYWIYYECFGGNDNGGETNKNFDLGDAYKGATTDAITKIASWIGIGIDVFKGKWTTPTENKTATTPSGEKKEYPKTEADDLLDQMEKEDNIDHLKVIFGKLYTMWKSDKQKAFYKSKYEQAKDRIMDDDNLIPPDAFIK